MTLNPSLLPLTIQSPNQRWEQSAPSYLKEKKTKEVTAITLGVIIPFGVLLTGVIFLEEGSKFYKTGILRNVILPLVCFACTLEGIARIYSIFTRAVYPYNLDNAGEVVKVRNQLINENIETINSTFSANAPHLRKTGILCSEDADVFKSIIKKYQELSKANKEINKFGDTAVSSNTSLQDRKDKVERSLIKVEKEWKAFQTEKLTKNLPNPSIEFNDLD
jgi:hypothetical protein